MRFSKYEGLGNDFVLVDGAELAAPLTPEQAVAICDRHTGVGADGVLVVGRDAPSMRVHNADGSTAEMCGNGLRCVALMLDPAGALGTFDVQTDAGPHACRVLGAHPSCEVEVRMRAPSIEPESLPVLSDTPLVGAPFAIEGRALVATAVSMGNPHLVLFDLSDADADELGPRLSVDPRFPEGVNVGFLAATDTGFRLRVHERGAGWTRACGTGACAAAYAAVLTGRAARGEDTRIDLPGGPLWIRVEHDHQPVWMRGGARHVYDGVLGDTFEKLATPDP